MKRGASKNRGSYSSQDVTLEIPQPFIYVSDMEWARAYSFFGNFNYSSISNVFGYLFNSFHSWFSSPKPHHTKLKKDSENGFHHNFLEVNQHVVAVSDIKNEKQGLLGKGGQGVVKLGLMKVGENYKKLAVKIEKEVEGEINPLDQLLLQLKPKDLEVQILEHEHLLLGAFTIYPRETNPLSKVLEKRYIVMKYVEGDNLEDININILSYKQRLIIALECCLWLRQFHQNNFIHGDIKPANIKVIVQGDEIYVQFIDFGYSLKLPSGATGTELPVRFGSEGFTAPEVMKGYYIGYASDVYSLGVVLCKKLGLGLDLPICSQMTCYLSEKRPTLDMVIENLDKAIENAESYTLNKKRKIKKEY